MQTETEMATQTTTERLWHYAQDGQAMGPISESEIVTMLQEGRLSPQTLLWTDSMSDWAEARSIETLGGLLDSVPVIAPPSVPLRTMRQRAEEAHAQGVPQIRPWVRYFARTCDLWFCAFVVGLVWGIAGMASEVPQFVIGLAVAFLWVFVEALLLSTWGATPGKWLLGTWVCDTHGERLSFTDALSRSFSVWFVGLGFCLPVVSLITLIVSYVRLKQQGVTSWDRDGRFAVIHERIGTARVVGVIILFILFGAVAALGRFAQMRAAS